MHRSTTNFGNPFMNLLDKRQQLLNRHEEELQQQEKHFWHDGAVMMHIPRAIFNKKRREYFEGMEDRHKRELSMLDVELQNNLPQGGIYTANHADANFAGMDEVRKHYKPMQERHRKARAKALDNFFAGIPQDKRDTVKQMYKLHIGDLEESQEKEFKVLQDRLFTLADDAYPAIEQDAANEITEGNDDSTKTHDPAMASLNPLKFNLLDKDMHVLNANELAYAQHLIAEFAKNNLANKEKP